MSNKTNAHYFSTPVAAADVRTETGPLTVHTKRTMLPVVATGALLLIAFAIAFSLGFFAGHEHATSKVELTKTMSQPFGEKMRQSVSPDGPGYVEPKAPLGIRKGC